MRRFFFGPIAENLSVERPFQGRARRPCIFFVRCGSRATAAIPAPAGRRAVKSITSKLRILGLGAWQAAHPAHRLLNFDGVATGPLGNQFVGELGGPSFAPGSVASVISIYNGVGTLSDIQTTGVNAISGPNVIGPDAGLNGSIFVSFLAPISAIGFNVYDAEGGSPRIRVDSLNFASAVSMVSGLGQFIGATFDAPVSVAGELM